MQPSAFPTLKRLYAVIENGGADLSDPMPKERIAELKATRDQPVLTQSAHRMRLNDSGHRTAGSQTFARHARKRMRTENGGYGRDHLRALAQRVEPIGGFLGMDCR